MLRCAIASSASAASLAASSSRSAGSTIRSAPASSVSSTSSGLVKAAWTGPRRPSTRISRTPDSDDRRDRLVRGVGRGELLGSEREHAGDVDRDVAVADHDDPLAGEVERDVLEVGVAVVPGDERRCGPGAGQVLAGDPHAPVGLRTERVDDGVVETRELLVADVPPHVDVPEKAEAGPLRGLLEDTRHRLDVRVVGRDPEPDEPPRRRQPLDHVDLDRDVGGEQRSGSVEAGRPRPDDGNAKRARIGHGARIITGVEPTPEQVEAYRRDGFVVIEALLPSDEVERAPRALLASVRPRLGDRAAPRRGQLRARCHAAGQDAAAVQRVEGRPHARGDRARRTQRGSSALASPARPGCD